MQQMDSYMDGQTIRLLGHPGRSGNNQLITFLLFILGICAFHTCESSVLSCY